jgi:hypothetical protein
VSVLWLLALLTLVTMVLLIAAQVDMRAAGQFAAMPRRPGRRRASLPCGSTTVITNLLAFWGRRGVGSLIAAPSSAFACYAGPPVEIASDNPYSEKYPVRTSGRRR